MGAPTPPGARVRWLVAGAFSPHPSGQRFHLTEEAFARLGHAAGAQRVTVPDRIGSGEVSAYEVSFDTLSDFQLASVIDSVPALRSLRTLHAALSADSPPSPDEAARLKPAMDMSRLASVMSGALQGLRSAPEARRAALGAFEEALFATASDLLLSPAVARLESAWRGLHWLWTHCPPSAGMDIEVLDAEPHQLLEALGQALDVPPLQRPDACFILDALHDMGPLHQLASLGEQASLPMVVALAPSLLAEGAQELRSPEAWNRLRADESSRWLCTALNPVVMVAEQQGAVRRECFTSPVLAVAALLAASFRDTRTFARLGGPGSQTRAPAVWQPQGSATVATERCLSLREQERLAARGILAVSGWWDSPTVLLSRAPTLYGGRDATLLPAQLLTGRLLRLALALTERIPPSASREEVNELFARAGEAFLANGQAQACQLHGQVVSTGNGERGMHVRASLRPELAGTHVQLSFILPLRG
jgi:hypothetical protein